MVRRWLNARSKTVASAAFILGLASMLSRLAGVVRDRLLSGAFGAGPELDAYYAAFRAPDFIYNLFVFGAISAGFIPVFTAYVADAAADDARNDDRAWDLASRVLTIIGLVLAVLSLAGVLTAHYFVPLMTPGFSPDQIASTVSLTRLMFLSPILLGLSGVLGGILQTYRRFFVYAFAPIAYNIGIIIGILALAPHYGISGVAMGVVIGAFFHFLAQLLACRTMGFKFRFNPDPRHEGVLSVGKLMVPRTAGLAVSQVNLLILTGMASTIGAGSIAVFNLANNLQSFPVNILGVSFAVAAFPFISEMAAKGRKEELALSFARTTRAVIFLIIPATVLFLLLRAQVVRVILGSGRFDWQDTIDTADALAYFTLSMFAQALLPLVTRAFFAFKDVTTPLVVGAASVVLERVLAWQLLRAGLGTPGLALAFSIASIVNLAALWMLLRFRVGNLGEKKIFRAAAVMSVCALAMAGAVQGIKIALGGLVDMHTFVGIFAQGAAAGLVGILVYVAAALVLGSEEAHSAVAVLKRRLAPSAALNVRQESETLNAE